MPGDTRRSRGDRNQRRHHADQRRFPRPIRSQQPEDLSFFYLEGNIVHGGEVAVLFHDVRDFNRVRRIRGHFALAELCSQDWCAIRVVYVRAHGFPAASALFDSAVLFSCADDTSTSAVMPGTYAPLGFSSRTFNTIVRMSRLRRPTSRCVANSASAAL